jgi:hypothetical protein
MVAVVVSLLVFALSYYFGLETRQHSSYLVAEQLSKMVEKTAVISANSNDPELWIRRAATLKVIITKTVC